tara:strand:+ start:305 stop:730 length:426 start_codon:yes stop_codon:yes gene_type:complete
MLTKKVKNRIIFLSLVFLSILIISISLFKILEKNLLYFLTPTEISNIQDTKLNKVYRIGGMVKKDSIKASKDEIKFIVTDFKNEILVSYSGSIPNLFAEGKGVVVEGELKDKKYVIAKKILAKHDENYMPPELKDIMKDVK